MLKVIKWRPEFPVLGAAASLFLDRLPAMLLAMLCLRVAELAAGLQTGPALSEVSRVAAAALGLDLITLVRFLTVFFLVSLPFLLLRSRRACFWSLGLVWSLLLLVQASLVQYFIIARVPLGADLFSYSWQDIRVTVSGGPELNATVAAGLVLALSCLWSVLALRYRREKPAVPPRIAAYLFAAALLVLALAPGRPPNSGAVNEYLYDLTLNKTEYFFDASVIYLAPGWLKKKPAPAAKQASAAPDPGLRYQDPAYPFLRAEQTSDVLGPYFQIHKDSPPNLVFIIVEGLGRAFSGPGAVLGSFTPQLDKIAGKSLYWENFLAAQGRTFGVLPSIFSSLPFGTNGFADLGERMPAHASLLSVLKENKYRLKCYAGYNMDFDNDRLFFLRQGADTLVDETNFGAGYERSNSWGFADSDLVSRVLDAEAEDVKQPFLSVVKTLTMHTPYTFRGQAGFYPRFEKYLDQLGVPEAKKASYRAYRDIYTSILYTDEALGRFLDETKKNPAYQNTIFIITGDHRLPEIPLITRIDRYHVPLLIFSPLLKAPARIKSVSSQFDLAPSLLAFLSHNYGLRTPRAVTWLGSGLDMEPSFRNLHDIPIKQTKTNLVDFVSGTWYINQGTLYNLRDRMDSDLAGNTTALALVQERFAAFRAANDQFARTLALVPKEAAAEIISYREEDRAKAPEVAASSAAALSVSKARVPGEAKLGRLTIEAVFVNTGKTASGPFVPLVVLLTADGRELSESYGPPQKLEPGKSVSLKLPVKTPGVRPGGYFLVVIPFDMKTGKSAGEGKYHLPIRLRD